MKNNSIFKNIKILILEGEKPETKQKRLEAKYAALQIVPNVDNLGTAKVSIKTKLFNKNNIYKYEMFLKLFYLYLFYFILASNDC